MNRYAFLLSLLFLSSCVNRNEINVKSRNFENEVEEQQNLVFTFSRDLVPDSLLNRWDTTGYIHFTPAVKGQFKWNTKNELTFSPMNGFRPSTDYKATLTNAIVSHSPGLTVSELPVLFHTPYLKLISATGYWDLSQKFSGKALLSVTLNFNNDIDPAQLKSLLKISLGEAKSNFTINGQLSKSITVVVDDMDKSKISSIPVKIEIVAGLKSNASVYVTKEPQLLSFVIDSPDKLQITRAEGEYVGTETVIHVYTNQGVGEDAVDKFIKLDPKVKFRTEVIANGFVIHSTFAEGMSYQLTVAKDMKGIFGGKMEADFSQLVPFGALEPSISFVSKKGIYLSSNSSRNIAVNIVNVPKVQVQVRKIYENNIVHYLRSNRWRDYNYDSYSYEEEYEGDGEDEEYEGDYSQRDNSVVYRYGDNNIDYYADMVFDRTYETRNLPKVNNANLLNLSLDDKKTYKGIYLVEISSVNSLYKHESKLVSISDIGLITKISEDQIYVFVNSIKTATPMQGVSISFISRNNQNVYTATTDGDGVAVFSNVRNKAGTFSIEMVTAKSGDDFNYLMLDDSRVNSSRFNVGGRHADPSGLMAFLYGDRNIYRPGENIYLNTIIVDETWQPVSNVPVKIKILLPDGKVFSTLRGMLDKQGSFSTSVKLPVATVTGTYIAEVYSANDVFLQSKDISVEEFMPDRIDVKLTLNKDDFNSDDSIIAKVNAVNLFGPPAADRKYETDFSVAYKYFYVKGFPGYNFSISGKREKEFANVLREGRTDKNGIANEVYMLEESMKNIGVLEGKVFATVFDETGRPVNRVKKFDIYTQDIFYGIKMNDYYVNAKDNIAIPLIAVDKDGKAKQAMAHVKIIRHDWYSVIEKSSSGGYRYVSHPNDRTMLERDVQITPKGYLLNYIPRESGDFEVQVTNSGNEHYVSSTFYAYGWGYTQNTSFQVNTEGQVEIKFDKEKYNPGDKANVLFTTPFSGKLLVTVECDKVLEYYYLNTDKKSAKLTLNVKDSYLPNVYVTATLFRPLDDGSIPLTVGHGFAPMIVNPDKNHLPVTIVAPAQSRSKTKQTIKIRTRPEENIELTVAVVDEGILQLKNFQTPDPYNFFYQKKALNVSSYDLYPVLLPDLKLKRSSTGGDASMDKRVNPLTNKRVKLVAFWSGILKTNSAGEATYTIDIPQFSGDLRVMACAYKNKAYGSNDAHIKVADPVVISSSIPRFLSPKDTLIMPVTLSNTTNSVMQLSARVNVTGPLIVVGLPVISVRVPAKSEKRVEYKVLAENAIGEGSINVVVDNSNEKFTEKTDITIRPSTSLLKNTQAGMIKGNTSQTVKADANYIPSSVSAKLIVSQNPMTQFTKQLNYLVGYPYGCLEQTTSKAFPQLYYSELVKNVKDAQATSSDPQYFVQEAIRKIASMQIYNGSFSYWPGGVVENWWATVYATHFLFECKKAGYDVSDDMLSNCMSYIAQKVKAHETETYFYWDEKNYLQTKTIAKKENVYSLYILALFGKPDLSSMNYYKSAMNILALDSRYMLACAYLAVGDRKSFDQILPKTFEGERSINCTGGSFYSYVRDEGIALNALLENDPENTQIGGMVRHLSSQLEKKYWLNTQEQAFAFLALGKFMKRQNENPVTAVIKIGDKVLDNFDGKEIVIRKGIANKDITIDVKGAGNLYYFLETEGISAKGEYKEEDSYLKARKTFFTRFGQPVSIKDIRQGDMIVIKLTLQNLERSRMDNVVLTDMLPAGFEIENPRISELPDMTWIKDEWQPDFFDVRDDRINFFTSVGTQPVNFYYVVRAVSTGSYTMGPVGADAMYNGEYHSYNGAGTVRIK
jgi:uncharacterized protein YfaS (alpha-2-macroglobulin family)